jgi:hypothetical protein
MRGERERRDAAFVGYPQSLAFLAFAVLTF